MAPCKELRFSRPRQVKFLDRENARILAIGLQRWKEVKGSARHKLIERDHTKHFQCAFVTINKSFTLQYDNSISSTRKESAQALLASAQSRLHLYTLRNVFHSGCIKNDHAIAIANGKGINEYRKTLAALAHKNQFHVGELATQGLGKSDLDVLSLLGRPVIMFRARTDEFLCGKTCHPTEGGIDIDMQAVPIHNRKTFLHVLESQLSQISIVWSLHRSHLVRRNIARGEIRQSDWLFLVVTHSDAPSGRQRRPQQDMYHRPLYRELHSL